MTTKKGSKKKLGRMFGRPDIERCDLFIDTGFMDWDQYVGRPVEINEDASRGPQMLSSVPSGGHKKCGLQGAAGYFDDKFKTILVGDPYTEKWRLLGRPPAHPRAGAWIPSGPAKHHSTPGDHYGTFTSVREMPAFSPLQRPEPPVKKGLVNFLTNPGKKGGSGYLDICINKYPPHWVKGRIDSYMAATKLYKKNWKIHKAKIRNGPLSAGFYPQPYFERNPYKEEKIGPVYEPPKEKVYALSRGTFFPPSAPKKMGNNHDGCFEKFTEWTPEPYKSQRDVEKELSKAPKTGLVFRPEPRLKTYYTCSVMNNKVDISCNERTWRTMKPITYPQFNL